MDTIYNKKEIKLDSNNDLKTIVNAEETTFSLIKERIPNYGYNDHKKENVFLRLKWLEQNRNIKIKHLNNFSDDSQNYKNNIETFIGVAQVPVGLAGPLKINGKYAKGNFHVPFATTEGVLVKAYTRGMIAITKSGGAEVVIHEDEISTSPIFFFDTLSEANAFVLWLGEHLAVIKSIAEKTTKYGKLKNVISRIIGNKVILTFKYYTGDAMGLNMINIATREASRYIVEKYPVKKYYLRSNFSSDKKVSAVNFTDTYGKNVSASVLLPQKIINRYLNSSAEEIYQYYQTVILSTTLGGMIGMNGQFANALAAIFIACGQDVASIVNSSIGISTCEITKNGDLYISIKAPNLVIGTIGGGTSLATQKECLEILGCAGIGGAKKFAEIIAATLLAGEISICSAFPKDNYMDAHAKLRDKD